MIKLTTAAAIALAMSAVSAVSEQAPALVIDGNGLSRSNARYNKKKKKAAAKAAFRARRKNRP
jgi:hypothetical protein